MAHLALVHTATPKAPSTDARLLKLCRQYLSLLSHLATLRDKHAYATKIALAVLRDRPSDRDGADLWDQLWGSTRAAALGQGIKNNEHQLAKLLTQIAETPSCTEAGLRARLQVWRTVPAADDADTILDSIISDTRKRRTRA